MHGRPNTHCKDKRVVLTGYLSCGCSCQDFTTMECVYLAVCNQSLSCQLAQMTVTALQIFLSLLWVQQKPVCSLQSELINHQTHLEPWQ